MSSEYNEYFMSLNKELIKSLKDKISGHKKTIAKEEVETVEAVEAVEKHLLEKLNEFINDYKDNVFILAKYQLGLPKFLDYYSYDWLIDKKIDKIVTKILVMASNINSRQTKSNKIKNKCDGQHDDTACQKRLLGKRFGLQDVTLSGGWTRLPAKDANTFLDRPRPNIIVPGQKLYRIIKDGINSPQGSFWMSESDLPIISKKEWRSDFAVLETWNKDDCYVVLSVTQPMYVWVGLAASQQATDECILPGGDFKRESDLCKKQVWVDRTKIGKDLDLVKIDWKISLKNS